MELTLQQLKQLLPKNPYVDHWHHAFRQVLELAYYSRRVRTNRIEVAQQYGVEVFVQIGEVAAYGLAHLFGTCIWRFRFGKRCVFGNR